MSRPEARQGIRDMTAHMRGLSKVEGHERNIKLSSNENPFGPSPLAVAAALAKLDTMHLYPEAGHIIDVLKRLEPSFPLTAAGMAAAIAALDDTEHTLRSQKHNDLWRERFSESLRELGLHVYPSQTNFVMARFPDNAGQSAGAADAHLLSIGIIARDFLAPAFEACLRITIGTADDMTATTNALTEFLAR